MTEQETPMYGYALRLPVDLATILHAYARHHHRSLNSQIIAALEEWVAQQPALPAPVPPRKRKRP